MVLLFIWSIIALGLNFLPVHLVRLPLFGQHPWEQYDQRLVPQLQSINDLAQRVKDEEQRLGVHSERARLELLTNLVRKRFFHGYSIYSLQENWIAAVAGRYVWFDLGAIVDPDDLMKYPMASCSQASLVTMAALRKLHIPSRKVGLKGHFALEARIGRKWYFVDVNEEPDFSRIGGRKALQDILLAGQQYRLYYNNTYLDSASIRKRFEKPMFGTADISVAAHALMFHRVTWFLSKSLWLLPFSFLCLLLMRYSRKRDTSGVEPNRQLAADTF
jgi:hypothetical protein